MYTIDLVPLEASQLGRNFDGDKNWNFLNFQTHKSILTQFKDYND